ncbi:hypothetical protein ACFQES_01025 [Nonomuraea salmonea]
MRILMLLAALLAPVSAPSGLAGTAEVNGCSGALVRTPASTPTTPHSS